MEEMSPDDRKALEEQKAQCPFCKIIKGDIPSRMTFQDDKTTAILDINPLVTGHTLLLTKEHYAILPLIPRDDFVHLFRIVKDYSFAAKRSLVKTGATVFIANGYTAGQISPHFMVHIFPRDRSDAPGMFDTEGKGEVDDKVYHVLKANLPAAVESHLKRYPESWHKPREIKREFSREQAIEIVEKNKGLRDAIMSSPDDFIRQAKNHPQLKDLFSNMTPEELVSHFNPGFKAVVSGSPKALADGIADDSKEMQEEDARKEVPEDEVLEEPLTKEGVIEMLRENPRSLEMIDKDPEEFKKRVRENPNLKRLFSKVDLDEVISELNDKSLERKL